ncbi:MAG: hypothetical protein M3Q45_13600, partial [Chloroflexota bacterium]|nr:hypothetical protein [Chloroflexota bacterium]
MVEAINIDNAQEHVLALLKAGKLDEAAIFLGNLHPADGAEIIIELESEQQAAMVERLQASDLADVFAQMYEEDMA